MKLLNNMKVGAKIVLLVAVLLVCLASVAGVGIYEMSRIDKESDTMYDHNLMGLSAAKEANIQLISLSRSMRNIALVSKEARPRYLEEYRGFTKRVREELEKVRVLVDTPEGLEIYQRTVKGFEEFVPYTQALLDKMDGLSNEQIVQELTAMRQYADATDKLMTEMGEYMSHAADERNHAISAMGQEAYIINISVLIVALLIGTSLGMMIKRAVANPLVEIAGKASRVAGGDLDQDFSLERRDELGTLSGSLAQMVANLKERIAEAERKSQEATEQSRIAQEAMVEARAAKEKAEAGQQAILLAAEQVDQVVNRLSAATEELSAQVEQSSRGTDQQRERVASSATAMEEMNATVLEVARNAGVAAEGSERAREKARTGQDIVQQSVSGIEIVQQNTELLRKNMEKLGQQAESIGNIMTVISDIADQTNLLALNAAIEAARAGEAGRGFAVVADEVRKLAEKTMEATKQVGDAIQGIQTGTQQSITAVEQTTHNLSSTTELVKNSGEALLEIVTEVEATAAQVGSIATAAEEQSAASEEITGSLEQINQMAEETAAAMRQSAQAVSDLAQQAQELQSLVDNLRKDRGAESA